MNTLSPPDVSARSQFMTAVSEAFDRAGVEHVFLHGSGADGCDSDVDVAVGRESLDAVDLLIRTGALGRLLQRFDYDLPWCRFYILAAEEPARRYRQLDVACDPWGIGRYGSAVRVALARARRVDGLSVPDSASEALYLAVKRARKGAGSGGLEYLQHAFDADPEEARTLMRQEFGPAGERVAEALDKDESLDGALAGLAAALDRRRRSPALLVRRTLYGSSRVARRVARPTGLVVGLAGPDGVGKSTLAEGLQFGALGAFRAARRLHLGPGLLPPPARLLGRRAATGEDPHGRPPSGPIGSAARVTYLVLDLLFGWPSRVAVPRVRSTLVLLERGLLDLTVDPIRYRLRRAPGLLRRARRLLPQPDLVLLLDAPATVVHRRKDELPLEEIDRQLHSWRRLGGLEPERFRTLDSTAEANDVLTASLDVIDDALALRQGRLELASLALECLGGPASSGRRYRIISLDGRPRWVLPRGAGPLDSGLYRPAGKRRHAAAAVVRAAAPLISRDVCVDPTSGLAPLLATALGIQDIELAAAVSRHADRAHRAILSVTASGRPVAFAKVTRQRVELERESAVLRAVARRGPRRFLVPDVIAFIDWRDLSVLLLRAHPVPGQTDRDVGRSELDALVELATLTDQLAPVVGRGDGSVLLHGDFCGWNSAPLDDGRLALWDWERAQIGLPLQDLFYWRLQRLALFGIGSVKGVVDSALHPDPQLTWLCRRLDRDPAVAPFALRAAAEHALQEDAETDAGRRGESIRSAVIVRLEEHLP